MWRCNEIGGNLSFVFQPDANKVVRSGVVPQMKVCSALLLLLLLLSLLLLLLHDAKKVVGLRMVLQIRIFLAGLLHSAHCSQQHWFAYCFNNLHCSYFLNPFKPLDMFSYELCCTRSYALKPRIQSTISFLCSACWPFETTFVFFYFCIIVFLLYVLYFVFKL